MQQLRNTPFHERTSALCQPQNWRKWAGYFVVGSYEHTIDREYWAIRNAAALIAYVSSIMTLEHGDLLFTGTPSGVGSLKDEDEVSVEIEGLGMIKNKVKAENS